MTKRKQLRLRPVVEGGPMVRTGDPSRADTGFSLAEVMVALGVLASVLISVAGLLVVGNRLVKSGRGSSQALAVARDLLEECDGWSFARTYEAFGCDPAQPSCTRDTTDASMASWRRPPEEALHQERVEVTIETLETGAIPLEASRALRLTVSVFWTEGLRQRSTRLTTVRM
jgi:hypothetical protein